MRSRYMLLGVVVAATLSAIGVIAAVAELWWLTTTAGLALLSAAFLAALDADRRIRQLRSFITKEIRHGRAGTRSGGGRRSAVPSTPPAVSPHDVVGTVKLMQAQYTGRLDRLQTAVDDAVRELHEASAAARRHNADAE